MDSPVFKAWLDGLRASVNLPITTAQTLATNTLPQSTTPAAMESVQPDDQSAATLASINLPAGTSQIFDTGSGTSPESTTLAAMESVRPEDQSAAILASAILPAGTSQTLNTNTGTLPYSTTSAATESVLPINELIQVLASLAKAEAKDEADARQPRTMAKQYQAALHRNSEWLPEHLVALLPPPSNNVSDDANVLRIFWNHVRTNSQHWQVCLAISETLIFSSAYNTIACNGSSNGQVRMHYPR